MMKMKEFITEQNNQIRIWVLLKISFDQGKSETCREAQMMKEVCQDIEKYKPNLRPRTLT